MRFYLRTLTIEKRYGIIVFFYKTSKKFEQISVRIKR